MGSVCCCFHVELPGERSNESTNGGCKCPGCLINIFFSKYANATRDGRTSDGAAISDTNIATPNTAQNETIMTHSTTLLPSVADKVTEQQITSREVCENQNSDDFNRESLNNPSQEMFDAIDYSIYASADDEDVCPTCLEEYECENPKIVTECNHHFHLGCIYEWMERSQNCPLCTKVMVFSERSLN